MKPINFIKAKHHSSQLKMHNWFWSSLIIITTLLICITILQTRLFIAVRKTNVELKKLQPIENRLNDCLSEKRKLKETTNALKNKLAKIARIKYKPKNPADVLQNIISLSPNITIQQITINKKRLTLTVYTSSTQELLAHRNNLEKEALFADVNLQSIEHNNKQNLIGTFIITLK